MRETLLAAALLTLAACSGGAAPAPSQPATLAQAAAPATAPATAPAATPAATAIPAALPAAPAGPTAEAEFWQVSLEAPPAFRPGEPAAAKVRIVARGGYHVNLDYPAVFVPAPESTADFASARVRLESPERTACADHPADACALTARVPLTPRPGAALHVAGTLAFSVCTAERCLIEKAALAVTAVPGR